MHRKSTLQYQLDPEIEKMLRGLRREIRGLFDLRRVAAIMVENEEQPKLLSDEENRELLNNEENRELRNNENHFNGHHEVLIQPNIIGFAK